jgi:hypothetical protein
MKLPKLPELKHLLTHPSLQIGIISLAALPFFYFLFTFFQQIQQFDLIEERFSNLYSKSVTLKTADQKEQTFLNRLKQADHHYLDHHLESLTFLQPEIVKLKHAGLEEQGKRLQFLEKHNRLVFAEEGFRQGDGVQEVEERQLHPIEVNEEDLKHLLHLIETQAQEGAPQLLVKEFRLTRKSITPNQAVFVVNMQLIKREGLSK